MAIALMMTFVSIIAMGLAPKIIPDYSMASYAEILGTSIGILLFVLSSLFAYSSAWDWVFGKLKLKITKWAMAFMGLLFPLCTIDKKDVSLAAFTAGDYLLILTSACILAAAMVGEALIARILDPEILTEKKKNDEIREGRAISNLSEEPFDSEYQIPLDNTSLDKTWHPLM